MEKIYGIELLECQKELIRSVARLPEGSRIVMGRKGPILLDKDGKLITKRKRANYYSSHLKRKEKTMAILIEDMKMPESCGECPFNFEDEFGREWCAVRPSMRVDDLFLIRHEDCPLREIGIGIDLAHTENKKCKHIECPYKRSCDKDAYEMEYCTAYLDI